ncbi:MAG TPA: hypothetical protein VGF88_22685 [Acidobacteriaceae bacterium]|jgi:hypothetical protein
MPARASRILLAFAALLLLGGAALHGAGFRHALPVIAASGMPRFYTGAFKGLWLLDSLTQLILAAILLAAVAGQILLSRTLLVLLALIPIGNAATLFVFLGPFPAEYLFLLVTFLLAAASFALPPHRTTVRQ